MELLSLNGPEEGEQPQTVQEFLELALTKIQGRLYKDGLALLLKALKLEKGKVSKFIQQRFDKCIKQNDIEQALTWGNALFRVQTENALLANSLGNCARKMDKFSLANTYYRHGLKQAENTDLLKFSLGASLAKTDRYDAEIGQALKVFDSFSSPLLPEYTPKGAVIVKLEEDHKDSDFEEIYTQVKAAVKFDEIAEKGALSDEDAETLYNLALFELKYKKSILAEDILSRILENHKSFNGLHILGCYASIFSKETMPADVIGEIKEAFIAKPKNRYLAVNLGLLYRESKNWLQEYKYLLTGLDLLEASQGLFGIEEQILVARKQYKAGHLEESVNFFQVVAEQEDHIEVLSTLGKIHFKLEQYSESVNAYMKLKQVFSDVAEVTETIKEARQLFLDAGSEKRGEGKSATAIELYENSVKIDKSAEAYKALMQIYTNLKDKDKTYEYERLHGEQQRLEEVAEQMEHREKLIKLGKAMISQKKFNEGLDYLKQAFHLKKDKDLFMLQAYLLKSLKRPKALAELLSSWKAPQDETAVENS